MPCVLALVLLARQSGPLDPAAERATFTLPPGYSVDLVVAEPDVLKVVDVAFDRSGAMWAVTASEYPLDGNEDPRAAALYARGGRDQVVVVERPWADPPGRPRVFADGLAMPMSVLPLGGGAAIVQHGSEILRLADTDGDGRADRREVLLTGFGIDDSHLMPHRFTRGPDGWIYTAQGAFNHSEVVDRSGTRTRFDYCKLGRFTPDGAHFEVAGVGLNNIWGIVFDERGELLVQEANDLGFGVAPFVLGASWPGIGQDRFRAYAPVQPPATELRFGGTGLSGLAWASGSRAFPAPYADAVFLANPIERRIQAVRRDGRGLGASFAALPELLASSDPRFRPVAIHFGPDGALYVVDWYNPIISHNEVPRTHPDRDRVRTRVWRVRHASTPREDPPDVARASAVELLAGLGSERQFVARASWQEIVDRGAVELAGDLAALARDAARPSGQRALALWSLEGLRRVDAALASTLLADPDPALRQAALRGFAASGATAAQLLALVPEPDRDPELEVRCEWLRALARLPADDPAVLARLLARVPAPDERETAVCEQDRTVALSGASYAAMRERMWLRVALEPRGAALRAWLRAPDGAPAEALALVGLAVGGADGARALVRALARLDREPATEEVAACVRALEEPEVAVWLERALAEARGAERILAALLAAPPTSLAPGARAALAGAARRTGDPVLIVRAALAFELLELADEAARIAADAGVEPGLRRDATRALARIGGDHVELLATLFDRGLPGDPLAGEALLALCASSAPGAVAAALERVPDAPDALARDALARLALGAPGAAAVVRAVLADDVDARLVDGRLLAALRAALPSHEALEELARLAGDGGLAALVLGGGAEDYVDSDLRLAPPFTVEAWVACEAPIDNRDGLLASPGAWDLNFAGALPRLWLGPGRGDVVIARTPLEPGRWTHVALTASAEGVLRLYVDGELDVETRAEPFDAATGLDVGRTTPGGAALAALELRVWSVERGAREIALDARRLLDGERPPGLVLRVPGDAVPLHGAARIEPRRDAPELLDAERHAARAAKFARYARLAEGGDARRGAEVFARACQVCHALQGAGESVGPPLDGAGARGIDGLLAALLEPSAAVESGYRELRVELLDGTAITGLLVRADAEAVTVRPATRTGAEAPRVVPRAAIARMRWSSLSVMPEGLLEAMTDEEAGGLLRYLTER